MSDAPAPDTSTPETPTATAAAARARALMRRLALGLVLMLVLLLGVLAYVLVTASGLRLGLALLDRLAPGVVMIEQVEGRLLGPLHVSGVALRLGELEIDLERADLAWSPMQLLHTRLHLEQLNAQGLTIRLPPPSDGETQPLTLPAVLLALDIVLDAARIETLRLLPAEGETPLLVLPEAQLGARLHQGELTLKQLRLSMRTPTALELHAHGQGQLLGAWPLDLMLDWTWQAAPELALSGQGRISGDLRRLQLDQQLSDALEAALHAELSDPLEQLGWDARLDLAQLDMQRVQGLLETELPALSLHGSLSSAGSLQSATLELDLALDAPQWPALAPLDLALAGRWAGQGIEIDALQLKTLGGEVQAQGQVQWSPRLSWRLNLNARGLDPGRAAPEWPGKLDAVLSSSGELAPGGPVLLAELAQLDGRLRDYPIEARARVALEDGVLEVRELNAASGPSRLTASGQVASERLGLEFALNSPDLASLLPEARGRLMLSGTLSGTSEVPALAVELEGDALSVAGSGVEKLSGTLDVEARPGGRFTLALEAEQLMAAGQSWKSMTLSGTGTLDAHRLEARLNRETLTLALDLGGGLDAQHAYAGSLSALSLESSTAGQWRLRRAAPVRWSAPQLVLGPLCLDGPADSGGCLAFEQPASGDWDLDIDWPRLDAELLAPVLPSTLKVEGQSQIRAQFSARDGQLNGTARAEIPRARIDGLAVGETPIMLDPSGAWFALAAGAAGLALELQVPLPTLGAISGELSLPGWTLAAPARADQPLRGQLRAQVSELDAFGALLDGVSELKGALDADLRLGGVLAAPELSGEARLREAGLLMPLIGLEVHDLGIEARASSTSRLTLSGGAEIGGKRLTLEGEGQFAGENTRVRLSARGERLMVANTREYRVLLSPDLTLELVDGLTRVRGSVEVPQAFIRPRSVPPGTVSPSPDVVLVPARERAAAALDLDLSLLLGEEVRLDAFGVSGRLAGKLRLLQAPGRDLLGDGQLQILDGQYRFSGGFGVAAEIGVPLSIEQGRLIYAQSPIGNPGLLLDARREGGDTTAGVRILGTLRDPKLTFFSESDPGMTPSEITKYLLTGMAPGDKAGENEAGLALGTYLTPRIYMEYESGLSGESNRVRLRYDVSPHIEVQTETGDSQGADIFFTIER